MIDIANDFNLTQMVAEPTRQGNILDLLFTSHPDLVDKVYIQPWSKRLGTLKKMRRENTPCLLKSYLICYKCLEMLLKEPVSAVSPPLSNVDCVEKVWKP